MRQTSATAALLASVLVPIVIAIVGHSYTSVIKEAENRVKYTELALTILKGKPEKDSDDIRAWAVDVINQYSGVLMDAKVKQQLIGRRLIHSDFTSSNFYQSDFESSNFFQSRFSGSNFDQSLFTNASFRESFFGGSDFRGADLSQAIFDEKTSLPPSRSKANK